MFSFFLNDLIHGNFVISATYKISFELKETWKC